MLSERQLQAILQVFEARTRALATAHLKQMGEHLKEIGRLTPSDVHRLAELKRMSTNVDFIKREIAKAMGAAARDVEQALYRVAESDYRFASKYYGEARQVPLEKNAALLRILRVQAQQTQGTLTNLSRTTVVSDAYKDAVSEAVQAAQIGVSDYNSTIRRAVKATAAEGLRVVEYESGHTRRLDSAVRMNVLDGVRQINQDVMRQTGKEFGADGVELSAHALCAEDHLAYQGLQYTNRQYAQIQATLDRPIGQWNCKHFAFPILWGASKPAHTDAQLDAYKRNSEERIAIDGVIKTRYEWTQEQRRIEAAIRQSKDTAVLAKASGDDLLRREEQARINQLQNNYRRISERAGLNERFDKTRVDGFRAVKAMDEETMKLLKLERQRKTRLLSHPALALPQSEIATAADAKFARYLFNPENPDGIAKGVAFESRLGYNKGNWGQLQSEILDAAKQFPTRHVGTTPHGERYEQRVILHGVKGNLANVKVGWIVDSDGVHMTTAFIEEVKDG